MPELSEMIQSRSPRYPRYSLEVALGYARRLYDGAHRSIVDTPTAYRVMGFAGKSGASATALGATRQFGLVESVKGGIRISQLGLAALEPTNAEERVFSLHVAGNAPPVFSDIMSHFDGDPPKSNEPIRSFLIRAKGFSKSGADDCIASFRETFEFLDRADSSRSETSGPVSSAQETSQRSEVTPVEQPAGSDSGTRNEVLRIPLSKNCVASLSFSGSPTQSALRRLVQHIELMQDVWAEE
jgi:hypothetical protein